MQIVILIGLDAIAGRALEFRGCGHDASDTGVSQVSARAEPGGAGFVDDDGGCLGLVGDERGDVGEVGSEPALDEFACVRVECCSDGASGVHVESDGCTLGEHPGLAQMLDRPGTGLRVR